MTGKNAEGYPDPTASIAVDLVTKKEKEKNTRGLRKKE